MAVRSRMNSANHDVEVKFATAANPQAHSIVEQTHQILASTIRSKDLEASEDVDFDWQGVLAAAACVAWNLQHMSCNAESKSGTTSTWT